MRKELTLLPGKLRFSLVLLSLINKNNLETDSKGSSRIISLGCEGKMVQVRYKSRQPLGGEMEKAIQLGLE